jgi:hypothetical protein
MMLDSTHKWELKTKTRREKRTDTKSTRNVTSEHPPLKMNKLKYINTYPHESKSVVLSALD